MVTLHPAPELRKLDYFAGTWLLDGEMKPGPMDSGGKVTETDINQWMDGGFFLVVRSEFTISGVSGTGVAYMGFDPNQKIYTYDEFNSIGDAIHSKGTVEGETWTWSGERKTESSVAKTRWVVNILSATSYEFKFESSLSGTWTTVMSGRAWKQ
jgi:hypothetical protein